MKKILCVASGDSRFPHLGSQHRHFCRSQNLAEVMAPRGKMRMKMRMKMMMKIRMKTRWTVMVCHTLRTRRLQARS